MDVKEYFTLMDRLKLSFYYNAFSSEIYNEYLKERIRERMDYSIREYDGIEFYLQNSTNDLFKLSEEYEEISIPRYDLDKNMEMSLKYFYRYSYITTMMHVESIAEDQMFNGMYTVTINFFLSSGCYATMALKQLTHYLSMEMKKKDGKRD